MASKGAIAVHVLIWTFFLTGLYDILFNHEDNACEMSYMFETPQYKQVPLDDEIAAKFPRYGLYLYGEGQHFDEISDLQLEGIPVLYIPGNGGSKKQCRSVASFLLRKAEDRKWDVHFNVFSADLNEELVAFYGGTLNDQVEFVHHSIKAILKLYERSSKSVINPQSVILVGHSMGGVIARGVLARPDFDIESVKVLYTLASPHLYPVFSLDSHISEFYENVNTYWKEHCDKLQDLTIVSVSGGDRDFQVHGAATRLPSCLNNSVSTATTAVPRAWVSADHQCAVWCKQIVLATTRSMFDMIDPKTKQITTDAGFRSKVLQYHFVHNHGNSKLLGTREGSKVKLLTSHAVNITEDSDWSSIRREIGEEPSYYFFDLKSMQEKGKVLAVARTTTTSDRWILGCEITDGKSAIDLSTKGYLSPMFKVAKFNISDLIEDKIFYLVVKLPKQTRTSGQVDVNFVNSDDLNKEHTVPHIFSNLWTLNQGYQLNGTVGGTKGQFYHKITLGGLYSIFHAYKLTFSPASSIGNNTPPMLELESPDQPGYTYTTDNDITVKLRYTAGDKVPVLHIYTDGETEYTINVKVQFVQLLGQIIRFDGAIIPTMIALNGMLALSYQLKILLSGNKCLSTSEAHGISAKPYKLQPFINLAKKFYSYQWFFVAWHSVGLPIPDAVRLDDEYNVWFALLTLVLFLYGSKIYTLLLFVVTKSIQMFGSMFGKSFGLTATEDWKPTFLSTTVHTVILATLVSQSGGLALSYICLLNFVDLCGLYATLPQPPKKEATLPQPPKKEATLPPSPKKEKDMETKNGNAKVQDDDENCSSSDENTTTEYEPPHTETKNAKVQDDDEKCSNSDENTTIKYEPPPDPAFVNYNIKLSMHQLWICLAALTLPTLVAQSKGYSFDAGDPSLASGIFGSLIFLLHRRQDAALQPSTARKVICRLFYPLTIVASMVCLLSIHRLPYFILSFQCIYVAMQYFG